MPSRVIPFINGQIYHVYNRGTEKRRIFETQRDYQRFLKTLNYYHLEGSKPKFSQFSPTKSFKPDLSKKIVEIMAYCLMPNHFHLLLKQVREGGITELVSKLSNSYTKYFNIKHRRTGLLLQGEFKSVLIESGEQLIHVSRYIHLNPIASFLVKNLNDYQWSSYKEYVNNLKGFCTKDEVLGFFKPVKSYEQFCLDQVSYAQSLERIKHALIDING